MGRFLTAQHFIDQFGEAEARQIAGDGNFNSLEGSQIDFDLIEDEIAYADELIEGYVLARHGWLADLDVESIPNLLRGLGGDIVRYRLRDKFSGQGQISETVETRYRDALKRLGDIQAGKLDLKKPSDVPGGTGAIAPASSAELPQIDGPAPQSDAFLEGYK